MIIDLVSITKIELDAFTGSFENERLSILSRILSLGSRIGISRKQGHRKLCEVRTNMNPARRFGEIVRHAFPEPLLSLLRSYTGGPLRFEGLVYKSRACEYLILGCKVIVWFVFQGRHCGGHAASCDGRLGFALAWLGCLCLARLQYAGVLVGGGGCRHRLVLLLDQP